MPHRELLKTDASLLAQWQVAFFVGFLCLIGICGCGAESVDPGLLLRQAEAALAENDFERAEQLAIAVPASAPERSAALIVAGEAAMRTERFVDALEYFQSVIDSGQTKKHTKLARFSSAEVYRELGQLSNAIEAYRQVLKTNSDNAATHERLAFLLSASGARWEALPHFFFLVRSGSATINELAIFADLDRHVEHKAFLQSCSLKSKDDSYVRFGLAAHLFWDGEPDQAKERLRQIVVKAPELISAQAMLGELLLDENEKQFVEWHQSLPDEAEAHPDIWYVRGLWARRHGDRQMAAHCFWQCVRRDPRHRRATVQLSQVLASLDQKSSAVFRERAAQMVELTQQVDHVLRSKGLNEAAVHQTLELLEKMGRIWETCAWGVLARNQFDKADWPQQLLARCAPLLNRDLPLVEDTQNLALNYDLSYFPEFQLAQTDLHLSAEDSASQVNAQIRFSQSDIGIDFTYFNSPDPSTKGLRVFESNGGGVAVVDFDGDEWPDLYFTQGAEWKSGNQEPTPSQRYTDRLYRNMGDSFEEITVLAGLGNQGFGQGPTVADFDNDGFPDLYIANIGHNRLYRNNGDGTFEDITDECGLTGEDWTASCVVVDLNADGLPDLFDVNYLKGKNVYTAICQGQACSPSGFTGTPDRLHLNQGDGTFSFIPDVTPVSGAKGMGVIASALHDRERPCLFVGNDQTPNFLLQPSRSDNSSGIRLENRGFIDGVSHTEDGLSMACMGIAADDVDGDGRIDFFVTNFKDESNTLYLQDTEGIFTDATKKAGLANPSWPFVGWGTQFLDADCNGDVDLVVVNGHVDDYRDKGGAYQMRPQFFKNVGRGRFTELFATDVGPWFEKKILGRGLARLDWNRDGLMDFVVSQIGEPISLMTNQTTESGHFINIRLHATKTARDAIGTVVEVATNDRRWKKQLVAGDGYMASNQRLLQFGLGKSVSVQEILIHWPSGGGTTIKNLSVDVTLELVEGEAPFALWRGSELERPDAEVQLEYQSNMVNSNAVSEKRSVRQ
ncbi:FG-GAP-like repeat-containing protein [uncultured Gimesia sp.]|uniref:FG-GAP-like repeat-containing protein n=1 Tax=uncultured Gimesia sp. TaxID=1678688 RepID=UPI0030DDB61B|tara:strand:+ start:78852 stop:81896 length:3045 start_codon:yes stop_codon:yes gene_type:complete